MVAGVCQPVSQLHQDEAPHIVYQFTPLKTQCRSAPAAPHRRPGWSPVKSPRRSGAPRSTGPTGGAARRRCSWLQVWKMCGAARARACSQHVWERETLAAGRRRRRQVVPAALAQAPYLRRSGVALHRLESLGRASAQAAPRWGVQRLSGGRQRPAAGSPARSEPPGRNAQAADR